MEADAGLRSSVGFVIRRERGQGISLWVSPLGLKADSARTAGPWEVLPRLAVRTEPALLAWRP